MSTEQICAAASLQPVSLELTTRSLKVNQFQLQCRFQLQALRPPLRPTGEHRNYNSCIEPAVQSARVDLICSTSSQRTGAIRFRSIARPNRMRANKQTRFCCADPNDDNNNNSVCLGQSAAMLANRRVSFCVARLVVGDQHKPPASELRQARRSIGRNWLSSVVVCGFRPASGALPPDRSALRKRAD